tara:strand:+ start:320 stop:451 length:132 start_codon:yes stop_codon:yes gene_type:complete
MDGKTSFGVSFLGYKIKAFEWETGSNADERKAKTEDPGVAKIK